MNVMKPADLKRFDEFATSRGYDIPRYVGACEAWEEQQKVIDELKSMLPSNVALFTRRDDKGRFVK